VSLHDHDDRDDRTRRAAGGLPDASRLDSLAPSRWRALGERLRETLAPDRVRPVNAIAPSGFDPVRMTILRWHLRRRSDVASAAMRLFLYRDALSDDEARAVLGDALDLARAVDIGLLAASGPGRVISPWMFGRADDLLVLYDDQIHGGDAVMGLSHTTSDLCRAALPARRVGGVLDIGCGAGTAALLCAARAERVVGTDINPRAVTLARINAHINGVTNAEFRAGDLFAPVAGETFDLVVSQPPFLAQPDGVAAQTKLHGGARGDELPLRLLRELPPHLAPTARAVVLVEWPVIDGEPVERRVRAVLPQADARVLQIECPPASVDDHCAGYALAEIASFGPKFEARFAERRDHFERMNVRKLQMALTVIDRKARARHGWTSSLAIRPFPEVALSSARIDAIVRARDLLCQDDAALLAARLRVPEGTRLVHEEGGVAVRFAPQALVPVARIREEDATLVATIDEAESVRAALERIAGARGASWEEHFRRVAPVVKNALLYGLLEVDDGAPTAAPP
jgi:methylase of polypeptide subunit release factors